jgi:hypothetical protein
MFPQPPITLFVIGPNILLRALFLDRLNLYFPIVSDQIYIYKIEYLSVCMDVCLLLSSGGLLLGSGGVSFGVIFLGPLLWQWPNNEVTMGWCFPWGPLPLEHRSLSNNQIRNTGG